MNRPDDAFDARLRRHFSGIDTAPDFAARLAERIATSNMEPAEVRRARVERQRETLRQCLRREAWTSVASAAAVGMAAIAAVWRHGPAIAGRVEDILAVLSDPNVLNGVATAVLAVSLWPVLQRFLPR